MTDDNPRTFRELHAWAYRRKADLDALRDPRAVAAARARFAQQYEALVRQVEAAHRTTRMAASTCPWCGAVLDCADSFDGAAPSPGDFSVCIVCVSILRFDDALRLCKLAPGEWEQLKTDDPEFAALLEHYQRAGRQLDRRPRDPISDAIRGP